MKVTNMISPQGNPVPNQFIVEDITPLGNKHKTIFQSYDSVIAEIRHGLVNDTVYLDHKYWNYSATTSKYRNIFLNEDTVTTKKKIASGEYILTNLN